MYMYKNIHLQSMLHPLELMSLVIGQKVIDWTEMEKVPRCKCRLHDSAVNPLCLLFHLSFHLIHTSSSPKQYTEYKNGYHKDHPVIKLFWKVFYDLPVESKKKFLGQSIFIHCMCPNYIN